MTPPIVDERGALFTARSYCLLQSGVDERTQRRLVDRADSSVYLRPVRFHEHHRGDSADAVLGGETATLLITPDLIVNNELDSVRILG